MQRIAELVERQRLHMKLDIGPLASRVRAGEQTKLRGRHGERAAAEERVVERHVRAPEAGAIGGVERLDARDLVDEAKLEVILQVLADAGPVEHECKP